MHSAGGGYREYILGTVTVVESTGTLGAHCSCFIVTGGAAPGNGWVRSVDVHCDIVQWFAHAHDNCLDLNSSTITFQWDWNILLFATGVTEG